MEETELKATQSQSRNTIYIYYVNATYLMRFSAWYSIFGSVPRGFRYSIPATADSMLTRTYCQLVLDPGHKNYTAESSAVLGL